MSTLFKDLSSETIVGVDHVQLAIPSGGEAIARTFYGDVLRLPEVVKPANLKGRGGIWFERGNLKIHLGVDRNFVPARKAHVALLVDSIEFWRNSIRMAGFEVIEDEPLAGWHRFYTMDPFGNRLEIMQPDSSFDIQAAR